MLEVIYAYKRTPKAAINAEDTELPIVAAIKALRCFANTPNNAGSVNS